MGTESIQTEKVTINHGIRSTVSDSLVDCVMCSAILVVVAFCNLPGNLILTLLVPDLVLLQRPCTSDCLVVCTSAWK